METVVVRLMTDAKRKSGKSAALLARIRPHIDKGDYSESSVSSWLSGRAMPPADVLLAIAKEFEISIDELLFSESLKSRQDRLELELGELREQIEGKPSDA